MIVRIPDLVIGIALGVGLCALIALFLSRFPKAPSIPTEQKYDGGLKTQSDRTQDSQTPDQAGAIGAKPGDQTKTEQRSEQASELWTVFGKLEAGGFPSAHCYLSCLPGHPWIVSGDAKLGNWCGANR